LFSSSDLGFRFCGLQGSHTAGLESPEHKVSIIEAQPKLQSETLDCSKSGKPFTSPNGHLPAWTSKVEWHVGSALNPDSYRSLLSSTNAVVHTLGTLFEGGDYKSSLKTGESSAALTAGVKGIYDGINGRNPLVKGSPGSYESANRDSGKFVPPSSPVPQSILTPFKQPSRCARHFYRRLLAF
jgi:hypothetical protein